MNIGDWLVIPNTKPFQITELNSKTVNCEGKFFYPVSEFHKNFVKGVIDEINQIGELTCWYHRETKKAKMINQEHSEDKIQHDCFTWFHNSYPQYRGLLFAIPNGGFRNAREANKLKATGVVPGIPDLQLIWGKMPYFFEVKTANGRISPKQKEIHQQFEKHDLKVFIIRSLDQFKELITEIIKPMDYATFCQTKMDIEY